MISEGKPVCLIRSDGSKRLGMGHIGRSLALASGLRDHGFFPVFILRATQSGVVRTIEDAGYPVEVFDAENSFSTDLEFTVICIERYRATLLVTDLCNNDTLERLGEYQDYLRRLKGLGIRVVTIDDLNTIHLAADIVINPNYGAGSWPYPPSPTTKYLLGMEYLLFRPEFIQAAGQNRGIREQGGRLLITLGGSDISGLTRKVLSAARAVQTSMPLEVRLGLALEEDKTGELAELIDGFEGHCTLFSQRCNMAEMMLWCDVAVTSGGLTKYETALTGTPSIVLSQVDHQHQITEEFAAEGSCLYLGRGADVPESRIKDELSALLQDHRRRLEMNHAGQALIDPHGTSRVLKAVMEIRWSYEQMGEPG